jgi:hypothetical protein
MNGQRLTCAAILTVAGTCGAARGQVFPAAIDLSLLNGTDGFVINGIDAGDRSGISVSTAGDVNGDGIDDIIIGADYADPNGQSNAGESYVVFGGAGVGAAGVINLSSLTGTNGFVINGVAAGNQSGRAVSSAGDINGDGTDDIIIGARFADPVGETDAGESYVVFGGAGVGSSGALNLSSLNGINGFDINGIDLDDLSGCCVSSAGDVNGDGTDDIIIGAYYADPNGQSKAGESYVVFGGAGVGAGGPLILRFLDGTDGFVINGIDVSDLSGWSVSSAGDFNSDGTDDIFIGARSANPSGQSNAGESYVVFGGVGVGAGGSVNLSSITGANGFVVNGIDANDTSGFFVSSAGDINGDGTDDIIIGAIYADPNGQSNAGESYVVFGGASVGAGGTLNLSTLNGTNGFVINGIDADDTCGVSLSSAGDINDDGTNDIIIGAWRGDPNGQSSAGESYVVFGGTGIGAGGTLNLSSLNGTNGFAMNGIDPTDYSGLSVSCAGDINGDGVDDILIGAVFADPNGQSNAGESYVIFGRPSPCDGDANGDNVIDVNDISYVLFRLGNPCAAPGCEGDVNGDGVIDVNDISYVLFRLGDVCP